MRQTGGVNTGVLLPLILVALIFVTSVDAITIDTVPVGDAGNPNDTVDGDSITNGVQNLGAVGYAYRIGKYEVTVGQYTAFLNAVAATDTYGLYDSRMTTDLNVAGISQSGSPGSYTYSVIGPANHPIAYVSWGSAARFANWFHNGQPIGAQNNLTTEDGAYTLNGAITVAALMAVTRNPGATWFLPTQNEWYKAAYYQPAAQGGDSDGYWAYPMKTNSVPYSDQPPGATPDNTRVGNFYNSFGEKSYDHGYAVTGSTDWSRSQNYLTDVGAYTSSPSYFGTFDQAGNVWEFNETAITSTWRGARGGAWQQQNSNFSSTYTQAGVPTFKSPVYGFRVASIQEPGDFNGDGMVDIADYVVWRQGNGSTADYNLWRAHFGESNGGSGTSFVTAIPEPPSVMLFMVALATFDMLRRRR